VTEEVVLRLVRALQKETNQKNLCLAGGVALNCVANGRVQRETDFENIWIQPAAGDAGGALGAALSGWYQYFEKPRSASGIKDFMKGSYLGPVFKANEIEKSLNKYKAVYKKYSNEIELDQKIAHVLSEGAVVGWFQGRMEFGPRALGGRSILGDPRNSSMQSTMNLKIKYRESFRPFAPAVLAEDVGVYFDQKTESPYMLLVAQLREKWRISVSSKNEKPFGIELLKIQRSLLPAITHVDYSARIQTVHEDTNPRFYHLIKEFKKQTDCSVLINTSFNVRGEPIVCTPEDAYRCFMRTEMDYLVIENIVFDKKSQPSFEDQKNWQEEFALD